MKRNLALLIVLIMAVTTLSGCLNPAILGGYEKLSKATSYAISGSITTDLEFSGSFEAPLYNTYAKNLGLSYTGKYIRNEHVGKVAMTVSARYLGVALDFEAWAVHDTTDPYTPVFYQVIKYPSEISALNGGYEYVYTDLTETSGTLSALDLFDTAKVLDVVNSVTDVTWKSDNALTFTSAFDNAKLKSALSQIVSNIAISSIPEAQQIISDIGKKDLLGSGNLTIQNTIDNYGYLRSQEVVVNLDTAAANLFDDIGGDMLRVKGPVTFKQEFKDINKVAAFEVPVLNRKNSIDSRVLSSEEQIFVFLNGEMLTFDHASKPVIIDERTMVPARLLFETLNGVVDFEEIDGIGVATGVVNGTTIVIKHDGKIAYVNGAPVELDVPAMIILERFRIPVRFVCESLGMNVDYANVLGKAVIYLDKAE